MLTLEQVARLRAKNKMQQAEFYRAERRKVDDVFWREVMACLSPRKRTSTAGRQRRS